MFMKKAGSWFWLILLSSYQVFAGTDGYFTTYSHHIEKGEVELMLMNDHTAPSKFKKEEGQGEYLSHMIEVEYGVTERYATEFMVEWFEETEKREGKFTGFRWENRYLLLTDNQFPINVMVYGEYEDLHPETRFKMETSGWIDPPYEKVAETEEPDRERIFETRLILSKDFGPINVAFNPILETDMSGGETAFGYAFGVMRHSHGMKSAAGNEHCDMHQTAHADCTCKQTMKNCNCGHCSSGTGECDCKMAGSMGLGVKFFGAVGDSKKFDLRPSRQEHYLGPILVYHISPRIMTHFQLGIGLSRASDNLVRFNVGYEF